MKSKVYTLDFSLIVEGQTMCAVLPGLVYDICGMDKNLVEMYKEEKNKTDKDIRLCIASIPFYHSFKYPNKYSRDLIVLSEQKELTSFLSMVTGLTISNPVTKQLWQLTTTLLHIKDPKTNADVVVDCICPRDLLNLYFIEDNDIKKAVLT